MTRRIRIEGAIVLDWTVLTCGNCHQPKRDADWRPVRFTRLEKGVVGTAQPDVSGLATLFARLWAHSTFDLPSNRRESPVKHRDAGRCPGCRR